MASNVRAKLRFAEGRDGQVWAEILTSVPLGPVELPDHSLISPEEYLWEPHTFSLGASGLIREEMRYIDVVVQTPTAGSPVVKRQCDLSDGSHERTMLTRLVDQAEIPIRWVNEGIDITWVPSPYVHQALRDAVRNTRGVSKAAWREEQAERRWRNSESWRPGPRPRPYMPRTATAPAPAIPFFAARSGNLPKAGPLEIAAVRLPAGKRQPSPPAAYWATNQPVSNLDMVAPRLAAAFPETGLWPLLWRFDDEPTSYLQGAGDLDAIDAADTSAIVGNAPIAAGSTFDSHNTTAFPAGALSAPCRLLLVPCNRPADAITQIGGIACETDPPVISATIRHWEERFGAVPYEVGPGLTRLHVNRPPADRPTATDLARQLNVATGTPADLPDAAVADALLPGTQPLTPWSAEDNFQPNNWNIAWR